MPALVEVWSSAVDVRSSPVAVLSSIRPLRLACSPHPRSLHCGSSLSHCFKPLEPLLVGMEATGEGGRGKGDKGGKYEANYANTGDHGVL